ncbi:hypothetical protein ACFE04_007606 [Oxalis oulophora]
MHRSELNVPMQVRDSSKNTSSMFNLLRKKLLRPLWSKIHWLLRRPKPKVVIRRFGKVNFKQQQSRQELGPDWSPVHQSVSDRPIKIATFNVAMFSLAPAVPKSSESSMYSQEEEHYISFKSPLRNDFQANFAGPKSILKQSPSHAASLDNSKQPSKRKKPIGSKLKVSINLPDNEISLAHSKLLGFAEDEKEGSPNMNMIAGRNKVMMRSPVCLPSNLVTNFVTEVNWKSSRSILEVLREVDCDILALQDVKAQEENRMKPLSDLAAAMGMNYVFAESWAPEYGNAILSKWPIKRWRVQKIANDDDIRSLLNVNELEYYSSERWADIMKYYEDIGKPTPRSDVLKFLKGKEYTDSKDSAGECEPVVIIAKGQNVQGTCKYGTRVDYILASPESPFTFVPGSYSVVSSKGTSDHHIVKVEITKSRKENIMGQQRKLKQKVIKITNSCSFKGLWKTNA